MVSVPKVVREFSVLYIVLQQQYSVWSILIEQRLRVTGICVIDTDYYLLIIPLLHCSLQRSKLGAARNFFSFKHTGRKQLLGEACNAYDLMLGGAGNAKLEAEYRERMLIPYILQHLHSCALMKWKFVNPLLILQGN